LHSRIALAFKYLRYLVNASNGRGHGVHSPFVFEFIGQVLNDKTKFAPFSSIESMRRELLNDHNEVQVEDFGAGSSAATNNLRTISAITKTAAKPAKFGQLLYRISKFYRPANMLELGTSLGLSAAYLASGNSNGKLITLEGSPLIAERAAKNLKALNILNAECVQGKFDDKLQTIIKAWNTADDKTAVDLAFIDGNHRKEASLNYFDLLAGAMSADSVIIFDDIHWSREMEEAWTAIKNDSRTMMTIDLFFIGLVFFRSSFKIPQHFVIRF
jgi:predicted O-methyltransferase YrrM